MYESGALTSSELTDRIRQREVEEKRIADELNRVQAALAASRIDGTSEERIEDIKASGLDIMLNRAADNPAQVRRWLKARLRVIVKDGEVDEVELI